MLLHTFSGILTNIQNLIVSAYQKLVISSDVRTGLCCDWNGDHTELTQRGEYAFTKFTLENYAEVVLEKDSGTLKHICFVELELQYRSLLKGKSLDMEANSLILHPGSTLSLEACWLCSTVRTWCRHDGK
jgi:hypothetical protein